MSRASHLTSKDYCLQWREKGVASSIELACDKRRPGRWSVGLERIQSDCDFVRWAGCDRHFIALSTTAVSLTDLKGQRCEVRPLSVCVLSGEDLRRVLCVEPFESFNVYCRRSESQASVFVMHLESEDHFQLPVSGHEQLLYLVSGEVELHDQSPRQLLPKDLYWRTQAAESIAQPIGVVAVHSSVIIWTVIRFK